MKHPHRARIGVATAVPALSLLAAGGVYALTTESEDRAASMPRADATAAFTGTWKLVELTATTGDGKVNHLLGPDADGLITYTSDGRLSATAWEADRAPFADADQTKGTPAEYAASVRGYIQYVGSYTIDPDEGTVSHHIAQSVFPNWNGTTQVRSFAFLDGGDRLKLSTPPTLFGGKTVVASVLWQRI